MPKIPYGRKNNLFQWEFFQDGFRRGRINILQKKKSDPKRTGSFSQTQYSLHRQGEIKEKTTHPKNVFYKKMESS
jgi:hypothetical protein